MSTEGIAREDVLRLVYEAVDDVNAQLGQDRHLRKETETPLVIGGNGLDSLAYVNLITSVEEKCEERFGRFVSLWEEDSGGVSYQTIGELSAYILEKLAG